MSQFYPHLNYQRLDSCVKHPNKFLTWAVTVGLGRTPMALCGHGRNLPENTAISAYLQHPNIIHTKTVCTLHRKIFQSFFKCNSMSGHEQTPHPTAAAAQPPRPAEMVPLAVTCPPHTEWMEGVFCSWKLLKLLILKLLKSKHTVPKVAEIPVLPL